MSKKSTYIMTYNNKIDESLFGGKFSKQAELFKLGINIPRFFCLSPEVYKSIFLPISEDVQDILHNIDWNSNAHIKEAESEIRSLFVRQAQDWSLRELILDFYENFFQSDSYVSVRSSMVAKNRNLSEDSKEHSFAGMSESFLYVTRDQLIDKIIECFASGYSSQVLLYRHSMDIDTLDFSVSVGVQEMVFGLKSFVCFTCDPNTMAEDTLVVAGYGIGEGVVQEKVETDHYFINAKTGEISRTITEKKVQILIDKKNGFGIKSYPVDSSLSSAPVLSDEELYKIQKAAKKSEAAFQLPQDVEGCFDEKGELFILQSRPVQLSTEEQIVWSNANVTESFPGTTTPLTYHFSRRFYEVIFRDCYRSLGVPSKILAEKESMLKNMIGFHFGKIYYNLTSFYTLHSLSPLFPFFRKQWEDMMGFSSSFYVQESRGRFIDSIKKVKGALYTLYGTVIILWLYVINQREVDRFLSKWDSFIDELRGDNYEGKTTFEILDLYHHLWSRVESGWWITLLNDTHLPTTYKLTESMMKKWVGSKDESLLSNLLCGTEELKSVEIIYSGVSLSEMVKKDTDLLNLFHSMEASEILSALNNDKKYFDFKSSLETHLYRYGDRGLQELKLEQPNIRHNPEVLIQMIKNYLERSISVDEIKKEEGSRRQEGERDLKKLLGRSPFKKTVLRFQLSKLRGFIRNRENMRYCRSEFFGVSKNMFMAIGKDFEKSRVLNDSKDIFYLTPQEIEDIIRGASSTNKVKDLVSLRQKEYKENCDGDLPMDFVTRGPLYKNTVPVQELDTHEGEMKGLGSCPGVVEGRARVVIDPNTVGKLENDEILIARETDPGWLFLMLAARGMVVERGSMLSHTAITGRKFGIPTIVSVPGVTKRLIDGQKIRINGTTGIVEVLE